MNLHRIVRKDAKQNVEVSPVERARLRPFPGELFSLVDALIVEQLSKVIKAFFVRAELFLHDRTTIPRSTRNLHRFLLKVLSTMPTCDTVRLTCSAGPSGRPPR